MAHRSERTRSRRTIGRGRGAPPEAWAHQPTPNDARRRVVLFLQVLLVLAQHRHVAASPRPPNWFQKKLGLLNKNRKETKAPARLMVFPESRNEKEDKGQDENAYHLSQGEDGDGETRRRSSLLSSPQEQQRRQPRTTWPSLLSALLPASSDGARRWGRYAATFCQIGTLAYLGHAIVQAAAEVVDEFNSASDSDSNQQHPAFRPSDVRKLIEFMMSANHPTTTTTPLVDASLLHLTRRLLQTGLPLRSSDANDDGDRLRQRMPSVESLLLELTRSEVNLLEQCLWTAPPTSSNDNERSNDDDACWKDIAGLDSVKDRLKGTLALLMQHKHQATEESSHHSRRSSSRYQAFSSLFSTGHPGASPSETASANSMMGLLLYGPPGCGKSLLVKSLAMTARLPCLVVTPSVLLRKYVGETNLQVRSLFSLAAKLSPCIVCIDELDGLLRERSDSEHNVNRELKTEFMQWWDGMLTTPQWDGMLRHPILVVGATNRPFDVDASVLRRLPQSYLVGLPDLQARVQLLQQLLHGVPMAPDLGDDDVYEDFIDFLYSLAERTEGYSPSDLRQVLQAAALSGPMMRQQEDDGLSYEDIWEALDATPPTPLSPLYRQQLADFAGSSSTTSSLFTPSSAAAAAAASDESMSTTSLTESGARKWETHQGNFYDVGTLEIDSVTFETLAEIAKQIDMEDNNSDDGDAGSENDEDSL